MSFHDGKARGFSLESFDWSRSLLSKLLHSKQASTVEKFVEVWKTDIQRDNCSTQPSGGLSRRTQHSTHRDRTTPSRKRTAADAQLDQNSSPPPSLCPVHIISDTQPPKADSDCTQLDEAIEKAFVGKNTTQPDNISVLYLLLMCKPLVYKVMVLCCN